MAQFTNYDLVGKKEDVSDVISNISPTKTPFQTMIGKDKVNNTLFQWQEDSLASVTTNAAIEGFTAADATLAATVMRQNYTQILQKTIKVSMTADAVSTYGRAKETAYQLSKASAELKRDLENSLVGTKQTAVAGSSGVARQFAGYQAQILAGNITSNAGTAYTEANLLTNLQTLYAAGTDPQYIMVTPTDSLVIANFAAASGRTRSIDNGEGDRKIVNAVDLYVSPFGEIKVVLNRFLAATDSLVFDPANWKLCTLRPWVRETLAKTGDNTMMMIVGEFSVKHNNTSASGIVRHI